MWKKHSHGLSMVAQGSDRGLQLISITSPPSIRCFNPNQILHTDTSTTIYSSFGELFCDHFVKFLYKNFYWNEQCIGNLSICLHTSSSLSKVSKFLLHKPGMIQSPIPILLFCVLWRSSTLPTPVPHWRITHTLKTHKKSTIYLFIYIWFFKW